METSTHSYTVQPVENSLTEVGSLEENVREINSLEELPYYVKFTVKTLSSKRTMHIATVLVFFVHVHTFFFMSQLTGSVGAGGALAFSFYLGHLCDFLPLPDFSKGFFLDILLSNRATAKKLNNEIKMGIIGAGFFMMFMVLPLFSIFLTYPFSQGNLLGPNTFIITLVGFIVSYPCGVIANLFSGGVVLMPGLTTLWKKKVRAYVKKVRDILVSNETNVESIVDQLSKEQEKINSFARQMSKGLNMFYSVHIVCAIWWASVAAFFIATPTTTTTSRIAVMAGFSLILFMCIGWMWSTLRGVSKPNLIWEEAILEFLSDAKIQHAKVNKLGWSSSIFNEWIGSHECKGLTAFGTHITSAIVMKGFSAFASIFTVGLYFVAREEIREIFQGA